MILSEIQLDIMGACVCGCCQDAVERQAHGRDPVDGCDCALYKPDERCDCFFCADVLRGNA